MYDYSRLCNNKKRHSKNCETKNNSRDCQDDIVCIIARNEHRDELITRCSSTNKTIYPSKEKYTTPISKLNKESSDVSKPKKRTRTTAANKCQQPILKTQCLIKNKFKNLLCTN
ncbi:hypothetical protein BpHYR1_007713 [Brachionus plicatilis]|uniref:Uncharacterized protein n=1 Tax=Brachionus plicatilis TaxID=10195 RepID=A0A3M7Q3U3_BRAPC|nr:hypothetical protein BpHYR1_007713 [Brachionus plicatilis]